MKNKHKNQKIGAIILVSVIMISSAMGVSAPGITGTETETSVSMPELTEEGVDALIASTAVKIENTKNEQAYVCDIDSVDTLKSFVHSINNKGLDCSGKIVNLNADIYWGGSWEPIKAFNGTFNGNGHTISGIDNQFITYVDDNAEIKNLNISASISSMGNIGGIVSINQGTISNCTFDGTILSDDDQLKVNETGCGGITGVNTGRIENCTVTEDTRITRDGAFCGGIAGISYIRKEDVYNPVQPGIYGCTNYAEINCNKRSNKISCGATGGIVGLYKIASEDAKAVEAMTPQLEKCINYGDINSDGAATGGIAGLCADTKINECENHGMITQTDSHWTGGIVGAYNQDNYYGKEEDGNDNIFFINNCKNYGFIVGVTKVGGIVGGDEIYSDMLYSQALMNINGCINTGDIYTTGYGGGLSGYSYSDMNCCINIGDVYMDLTGQTHEQQGCNAIGGIASRTSKKISNCINIGEIKVNTDDVLPFTTYSGGIVGTLESVGSIVDSYSSGPVTGNHLSTADEVTTVFYGGVAGSGPVSKITNATFNNTSGMAKKAVASYNGKDTDRGLAIEKITGDSAVKYMPSLFKKGIFEVPKKVIKYGVNYQLTPVLKNMPNPYELDTEKTLENASCAYLKIELPSGNGYTVNPLDGYDPDKVRIKGDFAFKVELDEAHRNYIVQVTADEKELPVNKDGVYRLKDIEVVPIIRVSITRPVIEPVTNNNVQHPTVIADNLVQNGNTLSGATIDDLDVETGDNNSLGMFVALFLMLCAFTIAGFTSRRKTDNETNE